MSAPLPPLIRDGPSEKLWKKGREARLWRGAGRLEVPKKKVFVHGFVNEKNDARRRALKIYVSALALKNILARIYINGKKKFIQLENSLPLPPNSFLVVGHFAG